MITTLASTSRQEIFTANQSVHQLQENLASSPQVSPQFSARKQSLPAEPQQSSPEILQSARLIQEMTEAHERDAEEAAKSQEKLSRELSTALQSLEVKEVEIKNMKVESENEVEELLWKQLGFLGEDESFLRECWHTSQKLVKSLARRQWKGIISPRPRWR